MTTYMKDNGNWNNQQTVKCNNPQVSYQELKAQRHEAQRNLSGSAYIIWTELADNIDGFEWKLSPAYFEKECGVSEASYKRAKKELEEKGYIIWTGKLYGYFNRNGKPYQAKAADENIAATSNEEVEASDWDGLMKSKKKKKSQDGKWYTFATWAKANAQQYLNYYMNEAAAKEKMVETWLQH